MSDPDLLAALCPVLQALGGLGVRHFVGGSIASSAHGVARAYRRGGEVSERQWTDVMGVLRATGSALDVPYLRGGAVELGVSDLLNRALDEAERPGT